MGNTESQNVNISGKGKANSLKLHKSKELSLSPHSWWKISEETSGPKAKHIFLSHNSSQHCIPQHYDSNKCRSGDESHCKFDIPLFQGNGFFLGYRDTEGNCSFQTNKKRPSSELIENKISSKVVFREDGCLRVEFSNAKRESNAEVPLIGYSNGSVDSTQRASNGSSISSEGSWYDSPWGNATDICDHDFTTGQPSENSSGYTTLSSTRTVDLGCFKSCAIEQTERQIYSHTKAHTSQDTRADSNIDCNYTYQGEEDSGIGDSLLLRLERSDLSENDRKAQNPAPFPTADILTMNQLQDTSQLQSSMTNSQDQSQELQNFAFHTLPHRKVPENTRTKDSLKKRIWRLGDWTGSISRKKRRVQEPSTSEVSEVFTCGDGGTSEEFRPFWNPLSSQKPFHNLLPLTGQVSQQHGDSAFKQNIYKNFKQELETGSNTGTVDGIQFWEGEDEQGESINGSVRSLEQIDFLFEKEQGVVRRAGWLSFKPLITLHKDRKLELVARCKWKQYWVTLKGCTLLLGESNIKTFPEQEFTPRYAVLAEDSIVQAVPEHPKRENVFCLSNSFGDVYLFQATNQTDLENWVTAIHSASASHLSKRHRIKDSLCLIRSQTRSILQKIDMDGKMKKMAELQLSVISDQKNRKAVENQILQWEQNLEKFNLELFRMRCYLASLQGTELPNPKSLLATVGRQSKMVLNRLGIFSVSSFHALICTRDEATLKRRSRSNPRRMKTKHGLLFSSQKGLDSLSRPNHKKRQSLSQLFEGNSSASVGQPSTLSSSERLEMLAKLHSTAPPEGHLWECNVETLHVLMPDGQVVSVPVRQDSLVADVISVACKIKELDPFLHCLLVKSHFGEDGNRSYPAPKELIRTMVFDELEVLPFKVFTLNMSRPDPSVDFGFAVTGHVDSARKSCIYISEVNPFGLAYAEGLRAGDEILTLNGVSVASLDLGLMQSFFCHQELRLLLRRENNNSDWPDCDLSATLDPPPPPPQADHMELENPDPLCEKFSLHSVARAVEEESNKTKHDKNKLETMCNLQQMFPEGHRNSSENGVVRSSPRHMSVTERLCMVIQELVDTEKSYVKDLSSLFEIYLNPLQKQTFLSNDEMESLFGSLPKMLDFQRVFLQTLEDRITSSMDYQMLKKPEKVKNILFSLGGSFLYYADHFKLYSGFCANHIKVQKVLERAKTDRAFREFLEARNPTKQHSSTLESYLIKPVQRVLKYPLLLRELVSLTDPHSDEHNHLTEALKAMEKVATHINEMQKIYEDYGTVFDQLVSEQSGPEKEISEISMGEFIIHSSALWLNPLPSLGRTRKEPDLTLFLFKRALILVYRESKLKKRMSSARLGEADPFKFRWLIPISSLQVLPGNLAGW